MKKYLSALLFIGILQASAQPKEDSASNKDTLYTTTGWRIAKNTNIRLAVGSLPNGDFKYITTSTRSWATVMQGNNATEAVGRKWNGHYFKVKDFRVEGNKKRGYVGYLILGGGNIVNYECDIESAIKAGEVEVPEIYKQKNPVQVVQVKQQLSIADELAKLHKLLQDSLITKNEYEIMKKKLIENN